MAMSKMDGYNIDFAASIQHELYERAFGGMMTLLFLCLFQRLYDEDSMPEVLGDNKRVMVTVVEHTKLMKDSSHLDLPRLPREPIIVPPTQFEGPSVPMEPIIT
ncbi:hypothetical protein FXO38_06353 [Capsicum annuum]|nr:hypothetical protein FXO38_06353 [Capsicum annuum]